MPTDHPLAGTWDVVDRHGEPRYVVEHDGKGGWWGVCQPDRPEDCYVLAASKDLLAALVKARSWASILILDHHEDMKEIDAAIKKAEGR